LVQFDPDRGYERHSDLVMNRLLGSNRGLIPLDQRSSQSSQSKLQTFFGLTIMGIHGDIRASLLTTVDETKFPGLARLGRLTKPIFDAHSGASSRRAALEDVVFVVDLIQHLYLLVCKHKTHYSGDDLYAHIVNLLKQISVRSRNGEFTVTTVVLVCDAQDKMTPLKSDTQKKRSGAIEPYAVGSILGSGGICEPTDLPTPLDQTNEFDPVNIRQLLGSRHLHLVMWRYIDMRLRADSRLMSDLGFAVIWDYGALEGPTRICFSPTGLCIDALRGCVHKFGEADLGTLYWCRVFRTSTIVLSTIDTDVLPLAVWYLSQTHSEQIGTQQVWWSYRQRSGKESKTRLVDLTLLASHIISSFGSARLFMAACVSCGTDFVPKGLLTCGTGTTTVLEGVISASSALRLKMQTALTFGPGDPSHCVSIIRRAASFAKSRRSITKVRKLATDKDAFALFSSNLEYWQFDWLHCSPTLPQCLVEPLVEPLVPLLCLGPALCLGPNRRKRHVHWREPMSKRIRAERPTISRYFVAL
jgi:hypothetical protein